MCQLLGLDYYATSLGFQKLVCFCYFWEKFCRFYWTFGSWKGPLQFILSFLPSFLLSFHLPGRFLLSLVFSSFCMVLKTQMKLCVTEPDFLKKKKKKKKKKKINKNLGKWTTTNLPKTGYFKFIEKIGH